MPIAALAVRQHGTGDGNSSVIRLAGSTPITVGHPFTILWLNAGITNGPYQVGELVQGSISGTIARVIHTNVNGFTNNIWVSITSGSAFNTSDVVSGLTSGAFGTSSGIGLGNNASNGILPPESDAAANHNSAQNRVIQFRGGLYCSLGVNILKLVGENWTIVHTVGQLGIMGFNQYNCHLGLHIVNINNQPVMATIYGNGLLYRVTTTDGSTYFESLISSSFYIGSALGVKREFVFNNILYFSSYNQTGGIELFSWDPDSDILTFDVGAGGNIPPSSDFITFNSTLLKLTQGSGGRAALFAYNGGSWTEVLAFDVNGITGGGGTPGNMQWGMWAPNDGFLYCMYGAYYNPDAGWVVKKVQFNGVSWLDVTPLTPTGPVPAGIKSIGPIVLSGTGLPIWLGGGVTNDPEPSRITVITDDATTPGTPDVYIYYAANDTIGTPYTVMKWAGPSTSMAPTIGTGSDVSFALPFIRAGGGERFWNYDQPDILITDVTPTAGGERLNFKVFPGVTSGNVAVTASASVTGTETIFTSQFVNGDKVIFASQPGIIYTILNIVNDTSLTLTSSYTGTVNPKTTAALSGTKSVQFFFSMLSQPPSARCTLSNPVSLGAAPNPTIHIGSPVNQQLDGVTLDGVSTYQVIWQSNTDTVPNLTRVTVQPVTL